MTAKYELSTCALSAFAVSSSTSSILSKKDSPVSTPSRFSTNRVGGVTPATVANFQFRNQLLNSQKSLNFNSKQSGNIYVTSAFSDNNSNDIKSNSLSNPSIYCSSQVPSNTEALFLETKETSISSKLHNPNLFEDYKAGDYTYVETKEGKRVFGQLKLAKGKRNAYDQRTVGGDDRHEDDDGGHIVGCRFDASEKKNNLDAQSSDLNRGAYKRKENEWAKSIKSGRKVFADISTYKSNSSDRPDAYMGYTIIEDNKGERVLDAFSFQNENKKTQDEWNKIIEETDILDDYENAMNYTEEQKRLIYENYQISSLESAFNKKESREYLESGLLNILGLGAQANNKTSTNATIDYPEVRSQILQTNNSSKHNTFNAPRSLLKTEKGWTRSAGDAMIYNNPIDTGKKLDYHQGKVKNFKGTCGLVSCVNVLRIAGVSISEADVVTYASTTYEENTNSFIASLKRKTLCTINSVPSSNGGTSASSRKNILNHFGIPSYTAPQTIETIAQAVASGHGVIASVHAEMLYFQRKIHNDLHAVTITSVEKDIKGRVLGFYICDPNAYALGETGATYYSVEEIEQALSERECNITTTIIR